MAESPSGGLRFFRREPEPAAIAIVRSAGRWFVFWGVRGHAVRAGF